MKEGGERERVWSVGRGKNNPAMEGGATANE